MTQGYIQRRKVLLILSVSCFTMAAILIAMGAFGPFTLSSAAVVVGAYTALMFLLLAELAVGSMWLKALAQDAFSWYHPPVLDTVWVLLFLGLPGLYALVRPDILAPLELFAIDPVYTVSGMWLVVLGCLCLWIGYGTSFRFWKSPQFAQRLARRQPSRTVVLAFFGGVVLLQLIQIAVVGIAYGADASRWGVLAPFRQWLVYFQDASRLVLALVALKTFRREWPLWTLVIVVIPQIGFGFISGFMKPILWIALILFLSALIARVNLRRLVVPVVVFFVLGLLVVPVAEDLRTREDIGLLDTTSPVEVASVAADSVAASWSSGTAATWQRAFDRTMFRNAVVAGTPGIIMQKTPSVIPYQGFEKFLAIPAYVIPRALWPNKPILSRGNWFNIVYLNQPEFSTSSSAITVFGEGYMYAGWVGTLLACLILGVLLAGLYRLTAEAGLWAVYIALVPTFIDVEAQFTSVFVALIQQTIVFLGVYWLLAWLSSTRAAASRFRGRAHLVSSPAESDSRSLRSS